MQAVILAGGLGTRLWPVTREIPKPMVAVAGAPYLEHQLRLLTRQGIDDVVLLTGYLGEQIEEHFGDGSDLGLRLRYSREETALGTGGAVLKALPLLAERFLVIYGDSYLPIEYGEVLETLDRSGGLGVLVAYRDEAGSTTVTSNLALAPDGRVLRYEKDSDDPDLTHVEAGVLALRRSSLELMPEKEKPSLEMDLFPVLVNRNELFAMPTTQRFYDIGTPERLRVIESVLS